jgi:hypothetical protein
MRYISAIIILISLCCSGSEEKNLNSDKAITSFSFLTANNTNLYYDIVAQIDGTTITAKIPNDLSRNGLIATYSATGSITVNGVNQTSGSSANNFNSDVTYTVTAEDASTINYKVSISLLGSNLLTNGDFEDFSSGSSNPPDYWTVMNITGNSIQRSDSYYSGTYSLQLVDSSNLNQLQLQQVIYSDGTIPSAMIGETVYFYLWIKRSVGTSSCQITISDGSEQSLINVNSGTSWSNVLLKHKIANDAIKLIVTLSPTMSTEQVGSFLFDKAVLAY